MRQAASVSSSFSRPHDPSRSFYCYHPRDELSKTFKTIVSAVCSLNFLSVLHLFFGFSSILPFVPDLELGTPLRQCFPQLYTPTPASTSVMWAWVLDYAEDAGFQNLSFLPSLVFHQQRAPALFVLLGGSPYCVQVKYVPLLPILGRTRVSVSGKTLWRLPWEQY